MSDLLQPILRRKLREASRRRAHERLSRGAVERAPTDDGRGDRGVRALRRQGRAPRIIAEVKFRSPSAGQIRPRRPGEAVRVARAYAAAGASAVSVLADGPGFGGSALDVRRVAAAVDVPVLFKEFVVDEAQVALARAVGASLVLLLVRAVDRDRLVALADAVARAGLAAVVEAADDEELDAALATGAAVVGVNARDLATFEVDVERAARCIARVPADRVAVLMSGLRSPADVRRAADTRADALLIGEGLMRAADPGARLTQMLEAAS